jgi:hypothetical protein
MAISTYVNTIAAGYGQSDLVTQLESAFTWLGWHEPTEVTGIATGIEAYMYQSDPAETGIYYSYYYYGEPDGTSGVGTGIALYTRRYYSNINDVSIANPGSGYTSGEFISFPVGAAASTLGFGITVYASPPTVSFGGTTNKFYDSHRHPTSNYNYGTLKLSVAPGKKYDNMFHVFRTNNNETTLTLASGPYWNGWGHFDPVSGDEYQVGSTGISSFSQRNADNLPCFSGEYQAHVEQSPAGSSMMCPLHSSFTGNSVTVSSGNSFALDLRVFRSGIDPKFAILVWNQPTKSSVSLDDNTYDAIVLHNFNPDFLDYDEVFCDGFSKITWQGGTSYPHLQIDNYCGSTRSDYRKLSFYRGYDFGIDGSWQEIYSGLTDHQYVNSYDARIYHRTTELEYSNNPAGKQPIAPPHYTTVKGIPLFWNWIPAPVYMPDDFVLISFEYEAPSTNIQTGDIITISPTEKYYVVTGSYNQSNKTNGVLLCARFV